MFRQWHIAEGVIRSTQNTRILPMCLTLHRSLFWSLLFLVRGACEPSVYRPCYEGDWLSRHGGQYERGLGSGARA